MSKCFQVVEFENDIRKLKRKYRHIYEDVERFCKVLAVELPKSLNGTYQITSCDHNVGCHIYKVKHFRSTDLMGKGSRSGFRIIYAYKEGNDKVTLLEIYHKNKKQNEDRARILKYCPKKKPEA